MSGRVYQGLEMGSIAAIETDPLAAPIPGTHQPSVERALMHPSERALLEQREQAVEAAAVQVRRRRAELRSLEMGLRDVQGFCTVVAVWLAHLDSTGHPYPMTMKFTESISASGIELPAHAPPGATRIERDGWKAEHARAVERVELSAKSVEKARGELEAAETIHADALAALRGH
jgi:hypothetical protein